MSTQNDWPLAGGDYIAEFDGRPVQVRGGDYTYEGRLCVAFRKSTGAVRFLVEDQNRRLFVHNADQTGLYDLAGERVLIPLTPDQPAKAWDGWLDMPRASGPYGDEHPEIGRHTNTREPGEFGDDVTVAVITEPRTPFIRSTCSGIAFDLANPTPEMVEPADIAWHLSMINR